MLSHDPTVGVNSKVDPMPGYVAPSTETGTITMSNGIFSVSIPGNVSVLQLCLTPLPHIVHNRGTIPLTVFHSTKTTVRTTMVATMTGPTL